MASYAGARSRGRCFPDIGASEYDLLEFRDRVINRYSVLRNMHMARAALDIWYYLGKQWATIDYAASFDGVRGALIQDLSESDFYPRPVTNEVDPAVEQTVISIVKRQWTARAVPTSKDPAIKAAAQVQTDLLQYRLEALCWPEKRHQYGLHYATVGTGLLYTAWDRSYADLKPIGAPSAVWCATCGTKLFSPELPVETFQAGINGKPVANAHTAQPVEPRDEMMYADGSGFEERMQLTHCPTCDQPTPLSPYTPNEDDIYGEDGDGAYDPFGRPLSVLDPRGCGVIETDLCFEIYPESGGARVTPDTLRRWGRRKIRSMEWFEERYPHLIDKIEPDDPQELLYDDPLLGSWDVLGHWSSAYDAGILDYHLNVDEVVELPSFRQPLGRYLVCTRDVVAEDGPLLEKADIDGEDYYVPRAQLSAARFKIRPTEFWGTGLVDHIISPQNRLNGLDSQVIETRLRQGSPNIQMPADMWPQEGIRQDPGYGLGWILLTQPSIENPNAKAEVIGGELFNDSVWMERDRIQADIQKNNGPQDPTRGVAPKNVGTTSGLQLLVEQDERTQSLREDEAVRAAEKSFSHLARMEWLLRTDQDEYHVLGPDKTLSYNQYTGQKLRGQCEIKIERAAFVTKSVVQREAAREAIADMLVNINSPIVKRRMLELYGLDTDLNPDTTNQIDHADRLWVDFADKSVVHVVDPLDDPALHFLVLASWLKDERGEVLGAENQIDAFHRRTAGWDLELSILNKLEADSIAFYGGRVTGPDAEAAYKDAQAKYAQDEALYQKQQAGAAELASNPAAAAAGVKPPPMDPPIEPPKPVEAPPLMQDRIYAIWMGMLEKTSPGPDDPFLPLLAGGLAQRGVVLPPDMQMRPDFTPFYQFLAVVFSYREGMKMAVPGMGPMPGAGMAMAGAPGAVPGATAGLPMGGSQAPAPPASTAPMPGGGAQ